MMRSVWLGILLYLTLIAPPAVAGTAPAGVGDEAFSSTEQRSLSRGTSNALWSALGSVIGMKPWAKVGTVWPHSDSARLAFSTGISMRTGWQTSTSVLYRTVHNRGPEWEFGISKALW